MPAGTTGRIVNLLTRGSHHRNLSVKGSRSISLNSRYLLLFKNARDKLQIVTLPKELYPGQTRTVFQPENVDLVDQVGQDMENAFRDSCEETLGKKSKQHKAYSSIDTLTKIEARKKVKELWIRSRRRAKRAETKIRYSEARKEVKRSIRKDRSNFVELYSITGTRASARKVPDRPVRARSGEMFTDQEEQGKRYAEHFRELLNRPPPSEMPDIEPADRPKQVNDNRPSITEMKRAIRTEGQLHSPDGSWCRWHSIRGHHGRCEHLVRDAKKRTSYQMTGKRAV